jgi:hypothetical protein
LQLSRKNCQIGAPVGRARRKSPVERALAPVREIRPVTGKAVDNIKIFNNDEFSM